MACHKEPPFTAAQVAGWQLIDSAPRDGSYFVTANFNVEDGEFEISSYAPYTWKTFTETEPGSGLYRQTEQPIGEWSGSNMHRATHWLAIPGRPFA